MKNQKGVTLIALVVTIIVLIILAGVAIATLMGDNGVITRSKLAKQNQIEGEVRDSVILALQSAKLAVEQKRVSSPSYSAQKDLKDNSTTSTVYKAIDSDLNSDYTITVNSDGTLITIVFTNGAYQQARNEKKAQITAKIAVSGSTFTFDPTDTAQWDITTLATSGS